MPSGSRISRRGAIALGGTLVAWLAGCRRSDESTSTSPSTSTSASTSTLARATQEPAHGAATTAAPAAPVTSAGSATTAGPSSSPAPASEPSSDLRTVAIDLAARRQTIDGFGFSARVWSDPHLSDAPETVVPDSAKRAILELLISDLGITRLRPNIDAGVEPSNDNDDPDVVRSDAFNFAKKRTDEHIDLVKQARELGLTTWFPAMLQPEPWMTEHAPEEFAERVVVQLLRWRAAGCSPALVSPLNEPSMPITGGFGPEWLAAVIRDLGRRLDAEGFDTKLLVPDDVDPGSALRVGTVLLDDPSAKPYIGALGYHLYGGEPADRSGMAALAQSHALPLWMTEYSRAGWFEWPAVLEWASIIDELLTVDGVRAVDYMWGFFGAQQFGHTLVAIEFDGGVYRSHRPTAAYWVTGQWARWVRPGAVRVETSVEPGMPRVSAFIDADQRTLVAVAINTADEARDLTVRIDGGAPAGEIRVVRSSATEQWAEAPTLTARQDAFDAQLPPASVTTFVVPLAG